MPSRRASSSSAARSKRCSTARRTPAAPATTAGAAREHARVHNRSPSRCAGSRRRCPSRRAATRLASGETGLVSLPASGISPSGEIAESDSLARKRCSRCARATDPLARILPRIRPEGVRFAAAGLFNSSKQAVLSLRESYGIRSRGSYPRILPEGVRFAAAGLFLARKRLHLAARELRNTAGADPFRAIPLKASASRPQGSFSCKR